MPFEIKRERDKDRVIRMGGQPKEKPSELTTKNTGRTKMADEKKLSHETGVKKISQENADKQGPVGTTHQPPLRQPDQEVKIGNKEGEKNA